MQIDQIEAKLAGLGRSRFCLDLGQSEFRTSAEKRCREHQEAQGFQ
jgi:hypothetical protein